MFHGGFLFSLVLILSATGSECTIFVSSSDGINNTSCWTGGYQTPCATLDLALQGAATATVQDNYCSSMYLSPGNYTLDTITLQQQRINVSIIGMSRYEEVSITCLNVSSSSLQYIVFQGVSLYNCNNVPVTCQESIFGLSAKSHDDLSDDHDFHPSIKIYPVNNEYLHCPSPCDSSCPCEYLKFTASVTDNNTNSTIDWKNDLHVCVNYSSSMSTNAMNCYNVSVTSKYKNTCTHSEEEYEYSTDLSIYPDMYYELNLSCFNIISPFEVTLSVNTLGPIDISTTITISVTSECNTLINEKCFYYMPCKKQNFCLPSDVFNMYYLDMNNKCLKYYSKDYCNSNCYNCCFDSDAGQMCLNCTSGVSLQGFYHCAECENYFLGLLKFVGIEILPITIMIILVIIFNVQLTNGSTNGLVFYFQVIFIYNLFYAEGFLLVPNLIADIIDVCIAPNMSPLGAVSFLYVIGFYPLLLLLLIYVWIVLYDKGFRCVVCITRPFHRCMARFWSMTGIEPSLTHSIASIYIICFTQLTLVSVKILSFSHNGNNSIVFFFDAKQEYFKGFHALAGFFAILVLLLLILLPTLYIQFYPFKWFHRLLDCFHLRKQLLISLGDVFTGPYKNGSDKNFDYRFFAGFYLLARIIILTSCIFSKVLVTAIVLPICCFLLAVKVLIFRPFQRNIHNFVEVLILTVMIGSSIYSILAIDAINTGLRLVDMINIFAFGLILLIYIIYNICKMIFNCCRYNKQHKARRQLQHEEENQPLVNDDWIADRVENPQEYDEQHVPVRLNDVCEEIQYPTTASTTAATYGSINDTKTN